MSVTTAVLEEPPLRPSESTPKPAVTVIGRPRRGQALAFYSACTRVLSPTAHLDDAVLLLAGGDLELAAGEGVGGDDERLYVYDRIYIYNIIYNIHIGGDEERLYMYRHRVDCGVCSIALSLYGMVSAAAAGTASSIFTPLSFAPPPAMRRRTYIGGANLLLYQTMVIYSSSSNILEQQLYTPVAVIYSNSSYILE